MKIVKTRQEISKTNYIAQKIMIDVKRKYKSKKVISNKLSEAPKGAKSMIDIGYKECRWPYGDGANLLLCANKVESGTYCCEHKKQSYVTRKKKVGE